MLVNPLRDLQQSYFIIRRYTGEVVEGKLLLETLQHHHDQPVESLDRNRIERKLIGNFVEQVHEVEDEFWSTAIMQLEIVF